MVDFVGLIVLVVLVALFGFLAYRAWGSRNAILKWAGVILTGLLTLIFALALILAVVGTMKLNQNYNTDHPVVEVKVASSPDKVAWGEKYAVFCAGCHSSNQALPLTGSNFGEELPFPIGTLYAPNLTPAGEIKDWSDGEVIRAIREGVHKDGRALVIMPSQIFHSLSDEDVQSLVAYLRSQPATPPDTPRNNLNAIAAILLATIGGSFQTVQPHIAQPVVAPPAGVTVARGTYMVNISGCRDCHGENLAGGIAGVGPPPGPNLTAIVPKWSEADFVKTIQTGVDPTGHQLDPMQMPWKEISAFASETDLKAMFAYLHGLQELPTNK